jgi:hypothetical protein
MTATNFRPGDRVRMAGSPGFVGTFVAYFAPLPSGKRNAEVKWDRADVDPSILETVIEPVP